MLYGISVIFTALVAGEALSRLGAVPIPGSVMGMILLAIFGLLRRGFDPRVAHTANGLLRYLGVLFVPAGVGIMTLAGKIQSQGLALLTTLILSTVVTMAATAWVLQYLLQRKHAKKRESL
jgi:holin-like protein